MKSIFYTILLCFLSTNFYAQNATITGQVSDSKGILPNARVLISGNTEQLIYTNVEGNFKAIVPAGRYKISVEEAGYDKMIKAVVVKERETIELGFILNLSIKRLVKSATLIEQDVKDAPATIYTITAEEIRERGYRNLQDLLDDIPEVEIQKNASSGFKDLIGFRGVAGNEKFIILMDDIRVSSAVGHTHSIDQNYSLANAQRVEVLMGPASAIYGADAYSGVINIITNNGEEASGIQATASYGSFNTTENNIVAGFSRGDLSFSATASYALSDGVNFPKYYPEDYDWYLNEYQPNGNLDASIFSEDIIALEEENRDFHLGSKASFLNARLQYKNFEVGFTHNSELHSSSTAVVPSRTTFSEDNVYGYRISSIYGKYTVQPENAKWNLTTLFTNNITSLNNQSNFQDIRTQYQRAYKYGFGRSNRVEQRMSYVFSKRLNLVGGVSFEDVTALPLTGDLPKPYNTSIPSLLQDQYYIGTNVTNSAGEDIKIGQEFYNLQYNNLGGFAQVLYEPIPILQLTIGGRYDYNTRYGSSINPRVGLLLKPNESIRVKLLYGKSFLSPSPDKVYSQFGKILYEPLPGESGSDGFFSPFLLVPNPDLKPEQLSSYEASVSWDLAEFLNVSINGFYTQTSNTIFPFVLDNRLNNFRNVDVAYIIKPTNLRGSNYLGATIGLTGALEPFSSLKLRYYAYYSHMSDRYNQQAFTYAAEHTFKGGITFNYDRFSFTPKVLYRSASIPLVGRNIVLDPSVTEYYLLSAYLLYDIVDNPNNKISVFAEGTNLLNTRYYNAGSNNFTSLNFVPQAPLQLNFGATVQFK